MTLRRRKWGSALVALSLVLTAALSAGPTSAQQAPEPAEPVSRNPDGSPIGSDNRTVSISALGHDVEFDGGTFGSAPQVFVRDRVENTSNAVTPGFAERGSISDDGCVIAFTSAPFATGSGVVYPIAAHDRCDEVTMSVGSAFVQPGTPAPRPVPSEDGNEIAWSTGSEIQYAARSGNTYAAGTLVELPSGIADFRSRVAISDNGSVVAFETGEPEVIILSTGAGLTAPSRQATGVIARTVYAVDVGSPANFELIATDPDGAPILNAFDPSISGDGRLVSFTVTVNDVTSVVFVRDRAIGATRGISALARNAEMSRDGRYVAFQQTTGEVGEVLVARSTGGQPFESFEFDLVSYRDGDVEQGSGGSSSNPAISEFGRWVAFESFRGDLLAPGAGFDFGTHAFVRQRRPVLTVDTIDFGLAAAPVVRPSIVRNTGISGWRVTSVESSGTGFSIDGHDCPTALHPGDSCTIQVRYTPSGAAAQFGQVIVRDDSYPAVPLVASGRLIGTPDTTTTTTTTDPTPTTTLPGATTTTTTTTTTTIPVILDVGLSISPNPVAFAAATVGSPAPSQIATVTNTGDANVTVQTVTVSGAHAADFSIVLDGCTNIVLTPDSSCALTTGFVPSDSGVRTATLSVIGTGATSASTTLRGSGAFDARLMVTPEVATPGQVATVSGSGFPGSTVISITLGDDPAIAVTTDPTGGFMMPWLVLGGTPQGELAADDVAVIGSYDADPAPLLVVGTPMRPQSTATRSRDVRSHVSR